MSGTPEGILSPIVVPLICEAARPEHPRFGQDPLKFVLVFHNGTSYQLVPQHAAARML